MHYANQNLLSIVHQSLGTQHVTVDFFKRYARSPETRTFKRYFYRPRSIFTTYMRKRSHYYLSRYISVHRRKRNPILQNFTTQIKTTILSTLQNLRIYTSSLRTHASRLIIQNKPILNPIKNILTSFNLGTKDYRLKTAKQKNKPIQSQIDVARIPTPKQQSAIADFTYVP